MGISDKLLGATMLAASVAIFVYYSVWVLFLPFAGPNSPLASYFPPMTYAISIPSALLVFCILAVAMFFGFVMLGEARKLKKK